MNIEELKDVLNYLLDNNERLEEEGKRKITIEVKGEAGGGKTSLIQQIADERGAECVKLNLSQLEEIGDLVGIPSKEYLMYSPEKEEKWVTEKTINQFINMGYELCPYCEPRMSYAVPAWVPKDPEKKVILLLDDYTRASQLFMQATMELISVGEYVSWKLPKHTQIILTSNPDNSEYSVTSLDAAQQSRFVSFNLDFDVEPWAKWAESVSMRNELINFALLTKEIFERSAKINARSYTLFADAISGIKDISSISGLATVNLIAKGCFGEDGEYIGGMFVTFVHNKLDKLISPEKMVKGEWEEVSEILKDNIYTDGNYRADIASTLTLRFINYLEQYFAKETDKNKSEKVINRIIDICTYKGEVLLTEDLLYRMIKRINAKYSSRCTKLLKYPEIRTKLLA